MRLRYLLVFSFCFLPYKKAETWLPCMPFCDTMCTGVAAVNLTTTVTTNYAGLINKFASNGQSITNLSSTLIDQQATIYSEEVQASKARISAYDSFSKVISGTLEKNIIINEKQVDHVVGQLFLLKKSLRLGELMNDNSKQSAANTIDTVNNALVAIPQLSSAIVKHKIRSKEATEYQSLMTKHIGNNNITNQKLALLTDIDFDLPNPFTQDVINEDDWMEYQKQLFLIFNASAYTDNLTAYEKRGYAKRQLALFAISKALSETVTIPLTDSDSIKTVVSNEKVNVKKALFEQYKQHMLDVNVQTNTKASPMHSLLVIKNLQLAQKNMLLRELLETKKIKNSLLAASQI